MESLFACLCVVGFIWAGLAFIGAIFGRRNPGHSQGYGYNGGWGGGIGSFLGGMGLGWLIGNMWSGDQSDANGDMINNNTDDEPQYIDYTTTDNDWGNSDGGWDSGGGDWGGGDSGGDSL